MSFPICLFIMYKRVLIITIICLYMTKFTKQERGDDVDYCKVRCPYKPEDEQVHTVCMLNHTCEKGPACKIYSNAPFSEREKQEIVNLHNDLRNRIALGKEECVTSDGKQFPPAANMREIVWDKELEFIAQCWANQCPIRKSDFCRHKFDGDLPVGENSAWIGKNNVLKEFIRIHEECKHATIKQIEKFRPYIVRENPYYIGHFTQMIWWNTSQIGCARTRFAHPKLGMVYYVTCNYAAAGNQKYKPVYMAGEPCSLCPDGTKWHTRYKGLCGTEPSKSKIPNICKFASDKTKCLPYLGLKKKEERLQISKQGGNPEVNYCQPELSCRDITIKKHTVCQLRHNCETSPKCKNYMEYPLSVSEKKDILNKHNELRSIIAVGKDLVTKFGQQLPSAANMREMVWDEELEFLAQCWANQCPKSHDSCRKKSDGMESGQNLAWTTATLPAYSSIVSFFNEYINITSTKLLDRYHSQPDSNQIGHFTQIAHWNSTQIGCGRSRYHFSKLESVSTLLVCHYAWAGNYDGMEVYEKGQPCSKCPRGSKCLSKYPGLCSTQRSKSKMPKICRFSKNPKCKPILKNPGLHRKKFGEYFYPSEMPDIWQWPSTFIKVRRTKQKPDFIKAKASSGSSKRSFLFVLFVILYSHVLIDVL